MEEEATPAIRVHLYIGRRQPLHLGNRGRACADWAVTVVEFIQIQRQPKPNAGAVG
jgi:DNA-binding IclR family transcriptional regulator